MPNPYASNLLLILSTRGSTLDVRIETSIIWRLKPDPDWKSKIFIKWVAHTTFCLLEDIIISEITQRGAHSLDTSLNRLPYCKTNSLVLHVSNCVNRIWPPVVFPAYLWNILSTGCTDTETTTTSDLDNKISMLLFLSSFAILSTFLAFSYAQSCSVCLLW